MAQYLVTGGAGFIGSHLARALLASGHRVRILDDLSTGSRDKAPSGAELIVGDVANPAAVRVAAMGCDGIFHLAAIASVQRCNEDWLGAHRTNLGGTIAVFEAAKALGGAPVVWASSSAVYGDTDRVPIDESTPPHPLTAYGADKLGGELHAVPAAGIHGVPSAALRLFNVYGPDQDATSPYSGVIALFASKMSAGETVSIHGDGLQSRDFIYVADVVTTFVAAMDHLADAARAGDRPASLVANVGTGHETTVLALAETIRTLSGSASDITFGPERRGDIRRSVSDPSRLEALLGIAAQTELKTGLSELLRSSGMLAETGGAPLASTG
ncbi:MAG: NAD-dependent epimerase/dehydratase family protein [Pseudomonadota bacterium]